MASLNERCDLVPGHQYLKSAEYDISRAPEGDRLDTPVCSFRTYEWLDRFAEGTKEIARKEAWLGHRKRANIIWGFARKLDSLKNTCAEISDRACLLK